MNYLLLTITAFFLFSKSNAQTVDGIPSASVVYDIQFNSDGTQLAYTNDNSISIWNLEQKRIQYSLENGHKNKVLCLSFNDNNLEVASGGRDSSVFVWDLSNNDNKIVSSIKVNSIVTCIEFSPKSPLLVFGTSSNKIYLYDYYEGKIIDTLTGHFDDVLSLKFLNEKYLYSSSADGNINTWDLQDAKLLSTQELKKGFVRELSFNSDYTTLAACTDRGKVYFFRINEDGSIRLRSKIPVVVGKISSLDFGENKIEYVASTLRGKIIIKTNFSDQEYNFGFPITSVVFQPREDARLIVAVSSLGNGVKIIDSKDFKVK